MSFSWPDAWWAQTQAKTTPLWRGVEAQHAVATMKLVDSGAEQEALERILEDSKPPLPASLAGQHYLLTSPFRYPSPHASRFRVGGAPGIWYGAEQLETAVTELAYWRWRFLMDSEALRKTELIAEFTLFKAQVQGVALDLSAEPWVQRRDQWISDDYKPCQALAQAAQARRVQWIRYESARHVTGFCGAVLAPSALVNLDIGGQQTWLCKVGPHSGFMRHDHSTIQVQFDAAPSTAGVE